jgi:geranylgeranyl reductase family protein
MQSCDVLIVGGGPAGSTLAWRLRDSGLAVTLLDRKTFPRDKVCAGWVTPEVLHTLRVDPAAYAGERTLQPITGFRVSLLGRREVQTHDAGAPVSYGIRRFEFDHYLLQRATAEPGSTQRLLNTELRSLERDGDGWRVNGEFRTRLVVGAGGHFCPVARAIGMRPTGAERVVAAQEVEFELTAAQRSACPVDPAVPELFFLPELDGYAWVFRKGDWLNIGLGRESNVKVSGRVQAFREHLIATGRVPPDVPTQFKGHAYLLYHHADRDIVGDGVLLIGDSAGLAYPESGEGIRPAVESALLAAEAIEAAGGDFRAPALRPYQQRVEARFGIRRRPPTLLERVPMAIKRPLAGPLFRTPWFVRTVLVERWFLHRDVPALGGT